MIIIFCLVKKKKRRTIEKNNETKRWFLEKTNKVVKILTRLTKKTQIINIRNERGNITINSTNIKHIIREQH